MRIKIPVHQAHSLIYYHFNVVPVDQFKVILCIFKTYNFAFIKTSSGYYSGREIFPSIKLHHGILKYSTVVRFNNLYP